MVGIWSGWAGAGIRVGGVSGRPSVGVYFDVVTDDPVVELVGQLQHRHDVVDAVLDLEVARETQPAQRIVLEADIDIVVDDDE